MDAANSAKSTVRHKLQIHFDAHACQPAPKELARMSDHLDPLARQVGDFPQADLRIVMEWNGRNNEYVLKLSLLLPGETLVTSDHDPTLYTAFRRAADSLSLALKGFLERLDGVNQRREHEEEIRRQVLTPMGPVDEGALNSAVEAQDYPAFRAAITPYEDWLRLRVGRWVERYPDIQARMGRDFDVLDLVEGVFLVAFDQHTHRHAEVAYSDWLEKLIDATLRAFAHNPIGERENVNMARSACAVGSPSA